MGKRRREIEQKFDALVAELHEFAGQNGKTGFVCAKKARKQFIDGALEDTRPIDVCIDELREGLKKIILKPESGHRLPSLEELLATAASDSGHTVH